MTLKYAVFFWLLHTVVSQKPEITKDIKLSPEVLRIGDTARLHCVVTYQEQNPVEWIFTVRNDSLTLNNRVWTSNQMITKGMKKYDIEVSSQDKETTYTLVINNLQERDNGVYVCRVRYLGVSQHVSRQRNLIVQVPPKVIQSQTNPVVTIQLNQDAELNCASIGVPRPFIQWKRVDGKLLRTGQLIHNGSKLHIKQVTKADRGLYRCVANNNVPPQNPNDNIFDVLLDVQFPPVVEAVQKYYAQRENLKSQFECNIEGNPPPRIVWYKTDKVCNVNTSVCEKSCPSFQDLRTDQFYDLQEHITHASYLRQWVRRAVLIIEKVRGGDFVYYYCCGTNEHGCDCDQTQLDIAFECQGVYCQGLQTSGSVETVASSSLLSVTLLVVTVVAKLLS